MTLKIAVAVLAALSMATAADAATKKKDKNKPMTEQTTSAPAPIREMRPAANPFECYTDEGYGRRLPCDFGGK